MASIHVEAALAAPAEAVWAALRDVGNVQRLFPGVLLDCRLDGDTRVVSFANGLVARERIVAIDEARRRVVYAAQREGLVHHSAVMQVLDAAEGGCRFAWTTDVLPDAMAAAIGPLIEQGMAALARAVGPGRVYLL
jgi:carbon monoxide dehydrogenase subunit G